MKTGKLTDQKLNELVLTRLPLCSAKVTEGPGTGMDCGIIHTGGDMLAVSSDPVTGAGKNIGRIAINVSCNDIASSGIKPTAVNIVIIVPENSSEKEIIDIVDDIARTSGELGVDVVGGHTEVSSAVNKPIVITTAFGFGRKDSIVYSYGAKPGDSIMMTKYAAIEGTAIIASDRREELSGVLSEDDLDEASGLTKYLSVLAEGLICGKTGKVNAMHDATEGGVLGAVRELAEAAGIGCLVDISNIKMYPQTGIICDHFKIDPFRLISSGSMIISTSEPDQVKSALNNGGIECTIIGRMIDKGFHFTGFDGKIHELAASGPDELYKIL